MSDDKISVSCFKYKGENTVFCYFLLLFQNLSQRDLERNRDSSRNRSCVVIKIIGI